MFSTPECIAGVTPDGSSTCHATAFSPKIAIVAIAAAHTISRVPSVAPTAKPRPSILPTVMRTAAGSAGAG